jgi:hypothetical protein
MRIFEAVAVGALLVGGNEKEVRPLVHSVDCGDVREKPIIVQ